MQNLRLNIEAAKSSLGAVVSSAGTPTSLNTPDILNSIINITDPFPTPQDSSVVVGNVSQQGGENADILHITTTTASLTNERNLSSCQNDKIWCQSSHNVQQSSNEPSYHDSIDKKVFTNLEAPAQNQPKIPTVPYLKTQFIKEGLKHTIQKKRKNSGKEELNIDAVMGNSKAKRKEEVEKSSNDSDCNSDHSKSVTFSKVAGYSSSSSFLKARLNLTPEDEERRKRRRERNKIAATKCRNKKKERTTLLMKESACLEDNYEKLKSQISTLEVQRKKLAKALEDHEAHCHMKKGILCGN